MLTTYLAIQDFVSFGKVYKRNINLNERNVETKLSPPGKCRFVEQNVFRE